MFPKPKNGARRYWCLWCRRAHARNSRIGHLHKVYYEVRWVQARVGLLDLV
jgi:hypothetical protein